jgi:hypothetical protein
MTQQGTRVLAYADVARYLFLTKRYAYINKVAIIILIYQVRVPFTSHQGRGILVPAAHFQFAVQYYYVVSTISNLTAVLQYVVITTSISHLTVSNFFERFKSGDWTAADHNIFLRGYTIETQNM